MNGFLAFGQEKVIRNHFSRIKADEWINKYYDMGDKVSVNPNEENLAKLKELIDRGKNESEEAEMELMKQRQIDYEKIYVPA